MAHSLSARKRIRQSLRRRERNRSRRTEARSAVRKAREAIASGNQEEAAAAVREAGAILDRAARKRVIHANNASRHKARLAHRMKAAAAGVDVTAAPKRKSGSSRSRSKKS